ncbi:MAG: WG repeat-containing protein [Verrucomicrobium sp.]|nr:WG repeat-containing protein [Verrucomicrobium sp.]
MYPALRKADGSYYRAAHGHESMLYHPRLLNGDTSPDEAWNPELSHELEQQVIESLKLEMLYDHVPRFARGRGQGFIRVRRLNQFGLYNYLGEQLLDAEWDEIRIINHYAHVRRGDLFGVLSMDGTWVLPPRYHMVTSWSDGYFEVGLNLYRHPKGINITPALSLFCGLLICFGYHGAPAHAVRTGKPLIFNGRWGVFDEKGLEVLPKIYDDISFMSPERILVLKDGFFGMTNVAREELVPCIWDYGNGSGEFCSINDSAGWKLDNNNRLKRLDKLPIEFYHDMDGVVECVRQNLLDPPGKPPEAEED